MVVPKLTSSSSSSIGAIVKVPLARRPPRPLVGDAFAFFCATLGEHGVGAESANISGSEEDDDDEDDSDGADEVMDEDDDEDEGGDDESRSAVARLSRVKAEAVAVGEAASLTSIGITDGDDAEATADDAD
jgi:hypothetical protein